MSEIGLAETGRVMSSALGPSRMLAWWQLLRAANVFTAASNVIAGFLIVQHGFEPAAVLGYASRQFGLPLSGGGMVLNDFFDAEVDAAERPERPIPSGRISRSMAGNRRVESAGAGVFAAWGSGLVERSADVGADRLAARHCGRAIQQSAEEHLGRASCAMGWCRTLNVFLGASIAADLSDEPIAWAFAFGVGAIRGRPHLRRPQRDGGQSGPQPPYPQRRHSHAARIHRDRRRRGHACCRVDRGLAVLRVR